MRRPSRKNSPKRGPQDLKLRGILREIKETLSRQVGKHFQLILFGSYARNEGQPDSDVDLMVILPDGKCTFALKEQVRDAVAEFSLRSDYFFSVMIVSESMARQYQGFQVFDAVEKEGVPL